MIYRVARGPDTWQPPDWALAGPDGTFGNRFDDPEAVYRVLYASARRLGCYLETLARFRLDPALSEELARIEGDDDFLPLGHVPLAWAETRVIGSAFHQGWYADAYSAEWIEILRQDHGLEIDGATLQYATSRKLTQGVSRIIFNRGFDGICYQSRYGHDVRNWALFEPFKISPQQVWLIDPADEELKTALAIHGLAGWW